MTKFQKEMQDKIEKVSSKVLEIVGNDKQAGQLKDFQKATVERIDHHFRNGQNRVLVADEVGMGKTMIAKGTIANVAKIRLEEEDPLFKVVYICSNQAIAKQNIRTLDIYDIKPDVEDTRLSMQHLKVMEQENDPDVLKNYIQLIPLTLGTSFDTKGGGDVNERALICAVLELSPQLQVCKNQIRKLFMWTAGSNTWKWQLENKEKELKKLMASMKKGANKAVDQFINKIIHLI